MPWIGSLAIWRSVRNLFVPSGAFIGMMDEELAEYSDARDKGDLHGMIDALADMEVLITNEIAVMRYEKDLVMKQCVKHISSRVQDPIQAEEWAKNGPSGKWHKWEEQPESTLYFPDYSSCRMKS